MNEALKYWLICQLFHSALVFYFSCGKICNLDFVLAFLLRLKYDEIGPDFEFYENFESVPDFKFYESWESLPRQKKRYNNGGWWFPCYYPYYYRYMYIY